MKKSKVLIISILVLGLVIASVLSGCEPAETVQLKVVTSTSLMAQIVERVGGDLVDVVNIIPPAQCPGHFDVKPGDIQKLADADLFLLHGWQGEMFSQDLIATANNPDLTVVTIDVRVGENTNWMAPPVQRAAVDRIVATLSEADAENSAVYQELAVEYKDSISAKEAEIEARLAKEDLAGINVMCSDQLPGFIQWVGLNIVDTYGQADLPQAVRELVDKGREENVTLIIDNLQSGQDAGAALAEELGCQRIILTNFPGGFDNTETWEKAIDYDIELILEAIAPKAPEDVIPPAVPGFILHEKSNRVEPVFEGEEYSAYSFFVPKANSKFENKIHSVEVWVRLFKDDASSKKAFDALAQGGTSAAEIEVNDTKTILTYDEDFGETCAIQQQGRLVIYSDSIPPFEATTFDEDVLKDAAIEGLKAIRL